MLNIAIIGTGPTAIYTAKYLVESGQPLEITMFEAQAEAGKGTPYHQDWNSESMLSNIASIEIPPITETLVGWLKSLNEFELAEIGLTLDEIDERKFYPRIVLGEYFYDQLQNLLQLARDKGIKITINIRSHVEDVEVADNGVKLSVRSTVTDAVNYAEFTHVVMATGHVWPKESEVKPGYFISPWPPQALGTIGQCNVGILGTSLSAIDAMSALAVARGTFRRNEHGELQYLTEPGTENFKITLMSRKGLLPEADFYHTVPYLPLEICTSERIDALIMRESNHGLLDDVFALFKQELADAAPKYAARINLEKLSLEDFCKAYFHERDEHDQFEWAALNLAEAKANQELQHTVQWRYAILRMHEVIGKIVRFLSAEDFIRFNKYFKPIFVDDYATVPHESIERILAMHRAGKIEILSLGTDYELDKKVPKGVDLTYQDKTVNFPAFIEATGQRGLSVREFPFPTLWQQGVIKNATIEYENNFKKRPLEVGGIALDMAFHPVSNSPNAFRLYCPSIPFMLGQFPFAQGITSSHDIGQVVVKDLLSNINDDVRDDSNQYAINQTNIAI